MCKHCINLAKNGTLIFVAIIAMHVAGDFVLDQVWSVLPWRP